MTMMTMITMMAMKGMRLRATRMRMRIRREAADEGWRCRLVGKASAVGHCWRL
jgi:hypothetical protein